MALHVTLNLIASDLFTVSIVTLETVQYCILYNNFLIMILNIFVCIIVLF